MREMTTRHRVTDAHVGQIIRKFAQPFTGAKGDFDSLLQLIGEL